MSGLQIGLSIGGIVVALIGYCILMDQIHNKPPKPGPHHEEEQILAMRTNWQKK